MDRVEIVVYSIWNSTSAPTTTGKNNIKIAQDEYTPILAKVKTLIADVESIEKQLTDAKVPYTPGRGDEWKAE